MFWKLIRFSNTSIFIDNNLVLVELTLFEEIISGIWWYDFNIDKGENLDVSVSSMVGNNILYPCTLSSKYILFGISLYWVYPSSFWYVMYDVFDRYFDTTLVKVSLGIGCKLCDG